MRRCKMPTVCTCLNSQSLRYFQNVRIAVPDILKILKFWPEKKVVNDSVVREYT